VVSARFITLMADPGGNRVLIRGSAAARLLRLRVRIPSVGIDDCVLMSVLCCQVEISASSLSLVQRSPTVCGVSEFVLETSK